MELTNVFGMSTIQWALLIIASIMIGFSKTGISGLLMLATSIMASAFGGKETTGILLPILIVGDIFAVVFYKRHAEWKTLKRLLPWTFVGFAIALVVGNMVDDKQFKILIAVLVLICMAMLLYTEIKGEDMNVPEKLWFYGLTGAAAGFASMIGNAAGPIFTVYLLALGYKKKSFMGTFAIFFLVVNVTKVPLQILFWHNIHLRNLVLTAIMIPVITAGALFGVYINKKLNEKPFRYLILALTVIAAIRLMII
jgi:uncharacterized membrane protein YfcA